MLILFEDLQKAIRDGGACDTSSEMLSPCDGDDVERSGDLDMYDRLNLDTGGKLLHFDKYPGDGHH